MRDSKGRFTKGASGNPKGRPVGSRDRRTLLGDVLEAGNEEAIRRVVIDAALGGDLAAARMVWDRIYPVRSATEEELMREIEELEARVSRLSALGAVQ